MNFSILAITKYIIFNKIIESLSTLLWNGPFDVEVLMSVRWHVLMVSPSCIQGSDLTRLQDCYLASIDNLTNSSMTKYQLSLRQHDVAGLL